MHRNLLLPCDHLPLEIQPKAASKQKKGMLETAAENSGEEDEEDEEECGYFYQPVQPQMSTAHQNIE